MSPRSFCTPLFMLSIRLRSTFVRLTPVRLLSVNRGCAVEDETHLRSTFIFLLLNTQNEIVMTKFSFLGSLGDRASTDSHGTHERYRYRMLASILEFSTAQRQSSVDVALHHAFLKFFSHDGSFLTFELSLQD